MARAGARGAIDDRRDTCGATSAASMQRRGAMLEVQICACHIDYFYGCYGTEESTSSNLELLIMKR